VAEAQNNTKPRGATAPKLIVIAVLAIVLVVILYIQFGSSGETPTLAPSEYRPQHATVAEKQASVTSKPNVVEVNTTVGREPAAAPIIDAIHWKPADIETITAYDPFAVPAAFPQPRHVLPGAKGGAEGLKAQAAADEAKKLADALEKLKLQLKELEQRGVHVIVRENDQYAAVIGDRMLHVGDKINSFTVTAIDTDGVHVEWKESP
jgi:hypothetical protein